MENGYIIELHTPFGLFRSPHVLNANSIHGAFHQNMNLEKNYYYK